MQHPSLAPYALLISIPSGKPLPRDSNWTNPWLDQSNQIKRFTQRNSWNYEISDCQQLPHNKSTLRVKVLDNFCYCQEFCRHGIFWPSLQEKVVLSEWQAKCHVGNKGDEMTAASQYIGLGWNCCHYFTLFVLLTCQSFAGGSHEGLPALGNGDPTLPAHLIHLIWVSYDTNMFPVMKTKSTLWIESLESRLYKLPLIFSKQGVLVVWREASMTREWLVRDNLGQSSSSAWGSAGGGFLLLRLNHCNCLWSKRTISSTDWISSWSDWTISSIQ